MLKDAKDMEKKLEQFRKIMDEEKQQRLTAKQGEEGTIWRSAAKKPVIPKDKMKTFKKDLR